MYVIKGLFDNGEITKSDVFFLWSLCSRAAGCSLTGAKTCLKILSTGSLSWSLLVFPGLSWSFLATWRQNQMQQGILPYSSVWTYMSENSQHDRAIRDRIDQQPHLNISEAASIPRTRL